MASLFRYYHEDRPPALVTPPTPAWKTDDAAEQAGGRTFVVPPDDMFGALSLLVGAKCLPASYRVVGLACFRVVDSVEWRRTKKPACWVRIWINELVRWA